MSDKQEKHDSQEAQAAALAHDDEMIRQPYDGECCGYGPYGHSFLTGVSWQKGRESAGCSREQESSERTRAPLSEPTHSQTEEEMAKAEGKRRNPAEYWSDVFAQGGVWGLRKGAEAERETTRNVATTLASADREIASLKAELEELRRKGESLCQQNGELLIANHDAKALLGEATSALEHYESAHYDHRGNPCYHDKIASEALAAIRASSGPKEGK